MSIEFQAEFDISNIKFPIKGILIYIYIYTLRNEGCFAIYFKNKEYLAIFSQVLVR